MKKITKVLFLATALTAFGIAKSDAQEIVVRARLHAPGHLPPPPPAPSPRHVWVEGEWVPGGGTYVYRPGYWVLPPRPHAIWTRGHWRHRPHGWVWIPGHWR
ncbi:MAG: YXWGXW repeat-containing protein [Bacteroidetes bacterium]|nr:YXWGXW repeat-containing protein [Bacteroidota bacterium]